MRDIGQLHNNELPFERPQRVLDSRPYVFEIERIVGICPGGISNCDAGLPHPL